MFNALLKKRKSNKGFTLIELIVVIAIIAILSLLLVPRFLGFTESAKVSADKAACATIEKSILTLVATAEIERTNAANIATIDIPDTVAWPAAVNITLNTPTPATVQSVIENLIGTEHDAQENGKNGFRATITTDGAIKVATY